jgi:hypothetical protein
MCAAVECEHLDVMLELGRGGIGDLCLSIYRMSTTTVKNYVFRRPPLDETRGTDGNQTDKINSDNFHVAVSNKTNDVRFLGEGEVNDLT